MHISMEKITGTVKENTCIVENVNKIKIDAGNIDFIPGQWIRVFSENGEKGRAYSIASMPGDCIEICVKRIENGNMSNYICNLKENDKIQIAGPYGMFTIKNKETDMVFVATGTGITPFISMISDITSSNFNKKIYVIFGAKTEKDILYKELLEDLHEKGKINFIPVLSREKWDMEKGYVQDVLKKKNFENCDYYICGIGEMVLDCLKILEQKKIPKERIYKERYN